MKMTKKTGEKKLVKREFGAWAEEKEKKLQKKSKTIVLPSILTPRD